MDAIVQDRGDAHAHGGLGAAPAHSPLHAGLLRFIACGSVDDGKSTLIGRLLYDSQCVLEDQLEALRSDSRRFGTQGENLDFALLVDGLSAEREQGITIDVAYRYFATARRSFIVADAPGHEQYTRNMATGASTADLAIILIDARKGILPQTRRHSFIVSMLGVRHVAVAVNKMDLVDFDQATFERICSVYRNMTSELGFEEIVFFPISARDGDNVARRSPKTPWHRGKSLLDHLETARIPPRSDAGVDLLFPVQWVSRPDSSFRGYAGTVVRGVARPGAEIVALPRGQKSRIARIVGGEGDLAEAAEGQAPILTLEDEIDVSRGDVLVAAAADIKGARTAKARLLWTGDAPFSPEESYFFKLGAMLAQARITIGQKIDIHSFASSPSSSLSMNEIAAASLTLDREAVLLPYSLSHELGGFILIDKRSNETVAFGFVESEDEAETKAKAPASPLVPLTRFLANGEGGVQAVERMTSTFAAFLVSGILFYLIARDVAIALGLAVVDSVARPLVRRTASRIFAARARRRSEELQNDGAGI